MSRKNLVLKLWPKMLLTSEISVFFNSQHFINGLISDFGLGAFQAQKWCIFITLDLHYGFCTLLSHTKSRDKVLLLNFDPEHIKVNESALKEMVRMRQKSVFSWYGRILRDKNFQTFANMTE